MYESHNVLRPAMTWGIFREEEQVQNSEGFHICSNETGRSRCSAKSSFRQDSTSHRSYFGLCS